ncbi:MAG: rhodanese-like domain-containing protein [Leptospirales bacterium]|nr:rhodanese-like domain-containing protein [Leptospirales bacterium]
MHRNHFAIGLLLLGLACTADAAAGYEDLDAPAFARAIQAPGVVLIDVRTPQEYAAGHLHGARLMDYYESNFRSRLLALNRSQPVAVYCHSGVRSAAAARVLSEAGFQRVLNLRGGILSWQGTMER